MDLAIAMTGTSPFTRAEATSLAANFVVPISRGGWIEGISGIFIISLFPSVAKGSSPSAQAPRR